MYTSLHLHLSFTPFSKQSQSSPGLAVSGVLHSRNTKHHGNNSCCLVMLLLQGHELPDELGPLVGLDDALGWSDTHNHTPPALHLPRESEEEGWGAAITCMYITQ